MARSYAGQQCRGCIRHVSTSGISSLGIGIHSRTAQRLFIRHGHLCQISTQTGASRFAILQQLIKITPLRPSFERVTSTNQYCRLAMSQDSKLALVIKLTAVAAAILLAGLSVLNDARARGRSGGYPGGKVKSSWHWHNGYSHNRYKNRHSNPRQESRGRAPLGSQQGQPPRFQGTWHSSPAFGGHNQKPSRFQGEWEGSPGFGSQEQTHTSSNHHRQWRAGRKPKDGNDANVGSDQCDLDACQGVWREVPER